MRVYVEAFGCSQNQGEAESLRDRIHGAGHALAPAPEGSDASVLVTCGVIGATESRMLRRWQHLAERTPRVVVTGCLVPLRTGLFQGEGRTRTTFVGIREQAMIPELLGTPPSPAHEPAAASAAVAAREIVLAQGCTSHCTYCFSRLARGRLVSRPMAELLADVDRAEREGIREVRLSSLDTSCWGQDDPGGPRLPDLVRALGSPGRSVRIRIGMMSPQSLAPIADAYLDAMAGAPVFRFLHLPLQSGSDTVLAAMRRGYTVADVESLVARARRAFPDLMLATDAIVGFPTETSEDFEATLDLVDRLAPEMLNVTRFSPRPLTPAALLPPLAAGEVKRRSRRLTQHRMSVARRRMERWVGRSVPGWAVERGPGPSRVFRLENYLPVAVPGAGPLGVREELRIDGARSTYLLGRLA